MVEMDNLSLEELRLAAIQLVRQLSDEQCREVAEECHLGTERT